MDKYIMDKLSIVGGRKPTKTQIKQLDKIKNEFKKKLMVVIEKHHKLAGGGVSKLAGAKPKRKMSDARAKSLKERGLKIKKLMNKLGISLPEASKLLKQIESQNK